MLSILGRILRTAFLPAALSSGWLSAVPSPAEERVDLTQGVVDGQAAVAFWAVDGFDGQELLDPEGFEVRLVPHTDLDAVISKPAGEWFVLPEGRYKLWLEAPGRMTPYSSVLSYRRRPFEGRGKAGVVPVVPAGSVVLGAKTSASASTVLRLLHLESHNRAPFPQRELSRSVSGEDLRRGARMPEGKVVGALVERETGDYLALSRPVEVKRDAVRTIDPTPPRSPETDLLVRLERPALVVDHAGYDVELVVRNQDQEPIEPDVVVPTADRLYAIWYGLRAKQVTLQASSGSVFLPPSDVVLRPGKVESLRGRLRPLPAVDVHIELPPPLAAGELVLSVVLDRPGRPEIRKVELPPGTRAFTLERVVAAKVDLLLHAHPWTFHRPIDLGDGEDRTVYFEPRPIRVRGTVYKGDHGHPATVEFQTNRKRDTLRVETDASGAYEADLFRAGNYVVSVRLDGSAGPANVELLERPISDDAELDFHIPDNRFVVRVVDAETGEGIAGAEVMAFNKYVSEADPFRPSEAEKRVALRVVTGREGLGELQPLYAGKLELNARAEGYLPAESLKQEVAEHDPGHEIEIALEPVAESARVRLLLPDGLPAAHAEVRLQISVGDVMPLWSGTADGDGRIDLPQESPSALVLVRHRAAAHLVREMPAVDQVTWTLAPAAPLLAVVIRRPWGEPARWARLALSIDGRWLTGGTLAWLTGAAPAADAEGFWQARYLPASPLKILAWPPGAAVDPAGYEALAVVVPHPWRAPLELETAD